jgi:serine/threonine protein kinase
MGVVYLARDTTLGRVVAVKTLPKVTAEHSVRLRREARTMATLSHPNLATLYGLETWRGTPMLIVEYLERGTLADRLRDGPLDLAQLRTLASGILTALAHVHARGILHRDLKPSNIGFTGQGIPKLLDFGLARLVADAPVVARTPAAAEDWRDDPYVTLTNRRVGTLAYMSPEALRGDPPDPSFDLWSVAVVLVEALTGCPPSVPPGGEGHRPFWSTDWRAGLSSRSPLLCDVLANALNADPAKRPATAEAFLDRLNQSWGPGGADGEAVRP